MDYLPKIQVKKLVTLFTLTAALTACGGGGSSSSKSQTDSSTSSSLSITVSSSSNSSSSSLVSSTSSAAISASSSTSTTITKSSSSSLSSAVGSSKSSTSSTPAIIDTDGDGVPDTADAFPLDKNETLDTDGDKIGNNADTDDDNDGVPDNDDMAPLDSTIAGIKTLSITASETKPGYATLSWVISANGTNTINVLFNKDGASGYSTVAGAQGLAATAKGQVDLPLPLLTTNFMNGRYLVELRNASNELIHSKTLLINTLKTTSLVGYVKASNPDVGDGFGRAIALSADGNTLAIAATGESSSANGVNGDQADNTANYSGAIYVFTRTAGVWAQEAYLKASNTDAPDGFGASLSLSADGNTLAVGARNEASNATGVNGNQSDNSASQAGAVYVFTRTVGVWVQQAYIKASNTDSYDNFGWSVSLSADGNTLAVSAMYESSNATGINSNQTDNSANEAGAVYVFTRTGGAWVQEAYIKASNARTYGGFGKSVSLSADGSTLAVGGTDREASDTNGFINLVHPIGAVYVFTRTAGGWVQQAYIKASNTGIYFFGNSVSLSADGNTLAVSGRYDEMSGNAGYVYVFTLTAGVWTQQAYLTTINQYGNDYFGYSISLSSDGNTLAVGAYSENSNATGLNGFFFDTSAYSSGAVYVFKRSTDKWAQQVYIKASNTGSTDKFGISVSLSADGNSLAVGAVGEDSNATGINGNQSDNSAESSGAVYIY